MSPQMAHTPGSQSPCLMCQDKRPRHLGGQETLYLRPPIPGFHGDSEVVRQVFPAVPTGTKGHCNRRVPGWPLPSDTRRGDGQEFTRLRRGRKNMLISRDKALAARRTLTSENSEIFCLPRTVVLKARFPRTTASASPGILGEVHIFRPQPRFTESETLGRV